MSRRVNASRSGLRELLIAYREYRLPKSPPPPSWSAVRGEPDALLFDLKSGQPVVLSAATLLSAYAAAGMPARDYRQWTYGASQYRSRFLLGADDRLTEYSGQE